jgi:hypothetical protein
VRSWSAVPKESVTQILRQKRRSIHCRSKTSTCVTGCAAVPGAVARRTSTRPFFETVMLERCTTTPSFLNTATLVNRSTRFSAIVSHGDPGNG